MFDEKTKQLIFIGSDHAGFQAKEGLRSYLGENGAVEVTDLGCFNEDPCDYPDIAREVGEKVLEHPKALGILICGSGIGVAMAANKLKGIRAAQAMDENMAELSRKHNDANILTLGARLIDAEKMKKIVDTFLTTPFESAEERHVRRVEKISHIG